MKVWVVREHRGDSYRLFFQDEMPTMGDDHYWHHKWGARGIEMSCLYEPKKYFPNIKYDVPTMVELSIVP